MKKVQQFQAIYEAKNYKDFELLDINNSSNKICY